MARKNSIISVAIENTVIAITVAKAVDGNDATITIDTAKLDSEITERAMLHGLVQKVSDAAALSKDETAGMSESQIASTKYNAMLAVADRLIAGEWKQSRGEGSGPVTGVIYRAFSQWVADSAKKKKLPAPTEDVIRAVYDKKTRAEQLELRKVPEIAAIIEKLKAAKTPAKKVDTDKLLAGLGL